MLSSLARHALFSKIMDEHTRAVVSGFQPKAEKIDDDTGLESIGLTAKRRAALAHHLMTSFPRGPIGEYLGVPAPKSNEWKTVGDVLDWAAGS